MENKNVMVYIFLVIQPKPPNQSYGGGEKKANQRRIYAHIENTLAKMVKNRKHWASKAYGNKGT